MSRRPRVFISRTTAGIAALAEQVAEVLRQRGIEPIIQTGFYPSTHDVKGMLAEHLQQCDAVICLIGSAYGSGPHDPITKIEQPVHGLKDPRTKDRLFSYTQLELLIARDLGRPIYTFFIEGEKLPSAFAPELPELAQRQQTFISEFAKDGRNTYFTFSQWDQPANPARGLKQAIEAIKIEITVLAGKPTNLPYTSLGTLFKGRDEFLAELRQHLTAEGPVVIKGKRTIHGMGGVGKTRAAIEYAWKHADDYRALLFISADTPEALHRNLAALCGPLVLNLPEQNEKEQAPQVEAALRWLKLHPGWFLIIDNVDTDEAAEETKALLAKLATGHVLITSRISDWTGHIKSLDLDVLSEAASIAFLDERTEKRRPKKDDDHEKVAALVALLDCLALALEQAGAHISTSAISYTDYLALWESHRFDALNWHDEEKMKYPKSLAITYETSVAQLRSSAKDLFNILAWFAPDPIPRNLLNSRPNPADERNNLSDIERLALARYLSNGNTFSIHRLLQEIARQQQEQATAPAIPTEPTARPQGLLGRYFGKKWKPLEAQNPVKQPTALLAALEWVNGEMPVDTDDVRTWPIAVPLTPHAIAVAEAGSARDIVDPPGILLNKSALLLDTRADYARAEPLYRKALAIWETSLGESHPKVALVLSNLASLFFATNRHGEAEPLMRRALAICETSLGRTHPKVASLLSNLAHLLFTTNRLGEAEPLIRRALAMDEASFGKDHPMLAIRLSQLGQFLQATNRLGEAEPLMRRALAMNEVSFGKDHPKVAAHLVTLAHLLQATNRLEEAELLMRRALNIDETSFGKDHPTVAKGINNLATLLQATNRLAEAEPLMRRALAIDETSFGKDHPDVARDLNNLAQLLKATNHMEEAELLMRRALFLVEASFGKDHPNVATGINNLALLLKSTNRMAEAEPMMRRALAIDEASFGKDHPNVARDMNNLAQLLQDTNRLAEAEPLMRRALAIDENSFGKDHPDVARDLNNLATLLQATNRMAEAEPLMRRALAIDETSFGSHHPYVAIGLSNLATLLHDTNRVADAEPLMRRALAIDEASFGKNHPTVAIRLNNLGRLLEVMNQMAEAEPLMRRMVGILVDFGVQVGHPHPMLQMAINNYGDLLTEMGDTEAVVRKKIGVILGPFATS